MERQNQQPIETLVPQVVENSEMRENKNRATLPYHSPQVFVVGKAKRLVAGHYGDCWDNNGWWYC